MKAERIEACLNNDSLLKIQRIPTICIALKLPVLQSLPDDERESRPDGCGIPWCQV